MRGVMLPYWARQGARPDAPTRRPTRQQTNRHQGVRQGSRRNGKAGQGDRGRRESRARHHTWGTGTGSDVMSRIAAPMVGGMISSTVLTLAVIPAIYALVKQWRLRRGGEA